MNAKVREQRERKTRRQEDKATRKVASVNDAYAGRGEFYASCVTRPICMA